MRTRESQHVLAAVNHVGALGSAGYLRPTAARAVGGMNLLLYLLAANPRTASVEWRIDLAARAVLAKAILQLPPGSEISAQLNALRDSIGNYANGLAGIQARNITRRKNRK